MAIRLIQNNNSNLLINDDYTDNLNDDIFGSLDAGKTVNVFVKEAGRGNVTFFLYAEKFYNSLPNKLDDPMSLVFQEAMEGLLKKKKDSKQITLTLDIDRFAETSEINKKMEDSVSSDNSNNINKLLEDNLSSDSDDNDNIIAQFDNNSSSSDHILNVQKSI